MYYDLENRKERIVSAPPGDRIVLLGTIDGELIYGLAHEHDVTFRDNGEDHVPMYRIVIEGIDGAEEKTYSRGDEFFSSAEIVDNAINVTLCHKVGEAIVQDAEGNMALRPIYEESGLYNRGYLAYLFDLAMAGKNNLRSALIIDAEGSLPPVFKILEEALYSSGDVIRADKWRFLLFSRTDSIATLQYLASLVSEGVERHNAEHPEDQVRITVHSRMQTTEENSFEFLRGVMNDRETGNEMRDIVSMISELDRLDEELKLAADIQLSILPMVFPPFPERTEFDLYASMTPAKEVGGDFYDFFLIDSDHLALVIADVSGKGIPAALFMMVSKTMIKNQLMSGCDPSTALERVNAQLSERNSSMMFVTVWLAVIEISTGRGRACNAGHENPMFCPAGGEFEVLKYKHNVALGISKKAKYTMREFELHPGDCIFVYTDGAPEATNNDTEMFGEKRLVSTLGRNRDAQPKEIILHVADAVREFADGAPQFDDLTMLCVKYFGK